MYTTSDQAGLWAGWHWEVLPFHNSCIPSTEPDAVTMGLIVADRFSRALIIVTCLVCSAVVYVPFTAGQ